MVDEFRNRWNNYKSNDRKYLNKQPCFQKHIFEHFNCDGHNEFLENVSITFIDEIDPSNPEKRENYWNQTLQTMVPPGLNIFGNSGLSNLGCYKGLVKGSFILALDHPINNIFVFGHDF